MVSKAANKTHNIQISGQHGPTSEMFVLLLYLLYKLKLLAVC